MGHPRAVREGGQKQGKVMPQSTCWLRLGARETLKFMAVGSIHVERTLGWTVTTGIPGVLTRD